MITQSELKAILTYDADTGVFLWKHTMGKARPGATAGSVRIFDGGYKRVEIGIGGRRYKAHRLAWLYVHGDWPPQVIDHVNGDATDNRIANLRVASRGENQRNMRTPSHNTSGIKGVQWNKQTGKWMAVIKLNRKLIYLGQFTDKADAARAREIGTQTYHGEFGRV